MGNKTRIAAIEEYSAFELQNSVNDYLANLDKRVVDINYLSSFRQYENGDTDAALIAIIRYIDD